MADKDMTERNVFASAFPQAKLLICLYHTFRSFRREVVMDKMGISSGQRTLSLELLQQMAYATSEDAYSELYTRFCSCAPASVVLYFDENWHPIHEQWVLGMKYATGNFLNNTNNRLESINQKLKSVISRYSSLEEFVQKFFLILRVLRSERDYKAALTVQKVPVVYHSTESDVVIRYMKHLTHYAYQFVAKQVDLKLKVVMPDEDAAVYTLQSSEGEIEVSPDSCTCSSHVSMKLPCRHIFAARSKHGLDLFEPNLCDRRWTLEYYSANQRVFQSDSGESGPSSTVDIIDLPPPAKKTLSQSEKFRRASKLPTRAASLASEATGHTFDSRMALLQYIVDAWENNREIDIQNASSVGANDCEQEGDDPFDDDDDDDADNGPQSELRHLLSDQQKEKLEKLAEKHRSKGQSSRGGKGPGNDSEGSQSTSSHGQDPMRNPPKEKYGGTDLSNISMPPVMRKRGRPKGAEVTVIGLPSKKSKKGAAKKPRVVPFLKLHSSVKEQMILSWFVDKEVADSVIQDRHGKTLIEEDQVEVIPERLPHAVMDENVDIHLARQYFSNDAWMVIQDAVRQKALQPYVCKTCHHDLNEAQSIICDHCLSWFHLNCVGLNMPPKAKFWFCRKCHESPFF